MGAGAGQGWGWEWGMGLGCPGEVVSEPMGHAWVAVCIDELHSLLCMYFHIFALLADDHVIAPQATEVT